MHWIKGGVVYISLSFCEDADARGGGGGGGGGGEAGGGFVSSDVVSSEARILGSRPIVCLSLEHLEGKGSTGNELPGSHKSASGIDRHIWPATSHQSEEREGNVVLGPPSKILAMCNTQYWAIEPPNYAQKPQLY